MRGSRATDRIDRLSTFVRDYTRGMSGRELQRLFAKDAVQAYSVLTRDQALTPEPKGRLRRLLFRTRLAFLGLSYKLTPARRMLFAGAFLAFVIGLTQGSYVVSHARLRMSVDFSPFWFSISLGLLVLLLALELVDRVRVRDELEVARELQTDLLPRGEIPEISGYRFAHSYRTANEVGGDYYAVAPLPDGRIAVMVGDASGHGMAAGLVMAIADATFRTALDLDPSPERVLAVLNRTLCRTGTRRTFLSAFYGLLTPETGHLEYVCAGHPFPILRHTKGIEEIGCGGFPLGIKELQFTSRTATLAPGDLLLLYTDGLAEAVDPKGNEAFGYERIRGLAQSGGAPQSVHDRILAAFDQHVAGEPLRDDLTLLVMMRLYSAVGTEG